MNFRGRYLIGSAVGALVTMAGTPALAQEAESPADDGIIIVTAQKRAQNVQDVPMSITALGGDDLESMGVTSSAGLTEFVPNVELASNGDGASQIIVIRGVGLQDYNANNTPTTSMVVDDVYLPYNVMAPFSLFDTERVEILKGPQGGLYGRNTTAGAVSFVSRKPHMGRTEANAAVDIGNYGTVNVRGGVSVPLGDSVAFRLAGQHDDSDGWYHNDFLDTDVGGQNRTLLRGTLSIEPSSNFTADLRLTYGIDKSEASLPEIVGTLDPNASVSVLDEFGLTGFLPDMNIPYLPGVAGPAYCPSYVATGIPGSECINMARLTGDGDPYRGVDNAVYRFDDDFISGSLALSLDAGPVQIVSISSYSELDYNHKNGDGVVDQNNNPAWTPLTPSGELWQAGYTSKIKAYSQELRLLSNSTGPVTWLAGISYNKDDFSEVRRAVFEENVYWNTFGFPGGGILVYDQGTEAWSGYGQVGAELTDRLTLTVDARYTHETKDYSGNGMIADGDLTCLLFGIDDATCATLKDPVYGGIAIPLALEGIAPPYTADYKENMFSWKVNLGYEFDNAMVYANVGKGYKSGGFFGGFMNAADSILPYEPESNLAYEIGFKSNFAGNMIQLNGAVFHYDYKKWQGILTVFDTTNPGAGFRGLTNLGDVSVWGADLDLWARPADGLDIRLGLGLLDTEIKKTYVPDIPNVIVGVSDAFNNIIDPVGNEIPQAPSFSLNGMVRYEFPVGDGGLMAAFQISGSYTDDYFFSVVNSPFSREKGYARFNARLELFQEDGWGVALWGRNLTKEVHRTSIWGDGLDNAWAEYAAPRTWGLTLSYDWSN